MYYFTAWFCAILLDQKGGFRLYFALGLCRERRRQNFRRAGTVSLLANRGNPKRPAPYASVGHRFVHGLHASGQLKKLDLRRRFSNRRSTQKIKQLNSGKRVSSGLPTRGKPFAADLQR